jgi:hypothetical protein
MDADGAHEGAKMQLFRHDGSPLLKPIWRAVQHWTSDTARIGDRFNPAD